MIRRRRRSADDAAVHQPCFGARAAEEPVLPRDRRSSTCHRIDVAEPLLEPEIVLRGALRPRAAVPKAPITCSNSGN